MDWKSKNRNSKIFLSSRPREECGIFAVWGNEEAAKLTYFGLYALQHRGQESAGIVTSDGKCVQEHKAMGLVPDVFDEEILTGAT
jgi:amidophosphoribosyltransferase